MIYFTTFEFTSESLRAQNSLLGGGRYDLLVEQLGGNPAPAIGFAAGIERFEMILEEKSFAFRLKRNNSLCRINERNLKYRL
ncbi:MAG: ATP phosphoribosyltransferase regulatory subunit [Ignavibacteria bacterium]|nr:ATP phosphoribosyltransferase regulatory subunit [Ignavibacteria bacterium]